MIANVAARKDELPLGHGKAFNIDATVGLQLGASAAVDKGTRVARVAQHRKQTAVGRQGPRQVAFFLARALATRKQNVIIDQLLHRSECRLGLFERVEHKL